MGGRGIGVRGVTRGGRGVVGSRGVVRAME